LLIGVILALLLHWERSLGPFFSIALLLLFVLLLFRKEWKFPRRHSTFGLIYFSILSVCGFCIASLHQSAHNKSIELPNSVRMGQAQLQEPLREGPNSVYGTFKLLNYWNGDTIHSGKPFQFIMYASKDSSFSNLQPGAEVIFEGKIQNLEHSINPYQFDYAAYLEGKGVGGMIYVGNNYKIIHTGASNWTLKNTFQRIQLKCIRVFSESGIGDKEKSVLNALVLGYRSDLIPETKKEFANAGVVHILAVSGLHVGIIFIILKWILAGLFRSRLRYLQFIAIATVIWFYAGITGFSPSVLRASTMFSFIAFGSVGGKKGNTYNMIAASVVLLLLIDPLIVREIGFQLSYLAVIGIVFFHDIFKPLFWSKYWLIQKGWELFVVSVSAQIATAALSIYYFGQFPNYFFLSNLLVIPLATLSLYSGLLYLILHSTPYLGFFVANVSDIIVSSLTEVVSFFSNLPGSVTFGLNLNALDVACIYALIIFLILLGHRPNRVRIYLACSALVLLLASFSYKRIDATVKSELYILEGKKGSIALLRNGRSGIFIPLLEDSISYWDNEYYLSELIRKEGLNKVNWIINRNFAEGHFLLGKGVVYYQNDAISFSSNAAIAPSNNALLVLSGDDYFNDFNLDEFDEIVLDRSFKDYQKPKLFQELSDSSKVWDMDYRGVYVKRYSDFNF